MRTDMLIPVIAFACLGGEVPDILILISSKDEPVEG
jgi:hypothetical protein